MARVDEKEEPGPRRRDFDRLGWQIRQEALANTNRTRFEKKTMYAIIDDRGQQLKVEEGQELEIDLHEASAGDEIVFDRVLAISGDDGVQLGKPTLDGASVSAVVLGASQGPKLVVRKFRKRKNSRRKTGHRQMYTRVQIASIKSS